MNIKRIIISLIFIAVSLNLSADKQIYIVFPENGKVLSAENKSAESKVRRLSDIYQVATGAVVSMFYKSAGVELVRVPVSVDSPAEFSATVDLYKQYFEQYDLIELMAPILKAGELSEDKDKDSDKNKDKDKSADTKGLEDESGIDSNEKVESSQSEKDGKSDIKKDESVPTVFADKKGLAQFRKFIAELTVNADDVDDTVDNGVGETVKEELDVENVSEVEKSSDVSELPVVAEDAPIVIIPYVKSIEEKLEFEKFYTCIINFELLIFIAGEKPVRGDISFKSAGLSESADEAYQRAFKDIVKHFQFFMAGTGFGSSSGMVLDFLRNGEAIIGLGADNGVFKGQFLTLYRNEFNPATGEVDVVQYGRLRAVAVRKEVSFCKLLYSDRDISVGDFVEPARGVGFNFETSIGYAPWFSNEPSGNLPFTAYSVGTYSFRFSVDRGLKFLRPYLGADIYFGEDLESIVLVKSPYIVDLYAGFMFDYYFHKFSLSSGFGVGLGLTEGNVLAMEGDSLVDTTFESPLKCVPLKAEVQLAYYPLDFLGVTLEGVYVYHTPLFPRSIEDTISMFNVNLGIRVKF
jgi:hypothetical protein